MNSKTTSRLAFLSAFMQRHALTQADAAERIGFSRQGLAKWFTVDDTRLSNAAALVETCGCKIIFSYSVPQPGANFVDESTPVVPKEYEGTRLGFLRLAISEAGMSVQGLAEAMGVSRMAIFNWLKEDDLPISRLYDIENATGWTLRIRIVDNQ